MKELWLAKVGKLFWGKFLFMVFWEQEFSFSGNRSLSPLPRTSLSLSLIFSRSGHFADQFLTDPATPRPKRGHKLFTILPSSTLYQLG